MTLWVIIGGLLRRPRVATVVLASSLIAAALAYVVVPVHFTSTATLVLTTSPTNQVSTAGDPNAQPAVNPLLNFDEGLRTAVAILVQSLNSTASMERLVSEDGPESVTISGSGGAQQLGVDGPFFYISASSTESPEAAQQVVRKAKDVAASVLLEQQIRLKAPTDQLIGMLDVVPPTAAVVDRGNPVKAAGLAFVLAFAASLGIFYLLEVIRARRRKSVQDIPMVAKPSRNDLQPDATQPDIRQPSVGDPDVPEPAGRESSEIRPGVEDPASTARVKKRSLFRHRRGAEPVHSPTQAPDDQRNSSVNLSKRVNGSIGQPASGMASDASPAQEVAEILANDPAGQGRP